MRIGATAAALCGGLVVVGAFFETAAAFAVVPDVALLTMLLVVELSASGTNVVVAPVDGAVLVVVSDLAPDA